MLRYAGWLDGETLKLLGNLEHADESSAVSDATSVLKMKVLLGHSVAISDIQLLDSAAVTRAFRNRSFLKLLHFDPHIIHLRSRPAEPVSADDTPAHVTRTLRGLERAANRHWVSSSFSDSARAKEFFAWLASVGASALGSANDVLAEASKQGLLRPRPDPGGESLDDEQLRGAVHALAYFCSTPGASSAPPEHAPYVTYDAVLSELDGVDPADAETLDDTRRFIDITFGKSTERTLRSALQTALDEQSIEPRRRQRIWHTAVLAWNCATASSLALNGGVYGHLPGAVRVPAYRGRLTDVLVDRVDHLPPAPGLTPQFLDEVMGLNFDFSRLTWADIHAILTDPSVQEAREEYRGAFETDALDDDAPELRVLVAALKRSISERSPRLPELNGAWLLAAFLAALATSAASPQNAATAGLVAAGMPFGYAMLRDIALRARHLRIASTLERFERGPHGRIGGAT